MVLLNLISPFLGALSSSTTMIELSFFNKISFGKYNVTCGPTDGQYRPKLNSFTIINPCLKFELEEKGRNKMMQFIFKINK